jgi:predicted unusual protein kinase regulating ubiquinone biosynthesis (AarF/ABC1/UbiB family)
VESDPKNLPVGRLSRLTSLARVGLRTGATLLLSRETDAAAKQAAEVLGKLRGLAAKVGQMASYVDGFIPEAHRESYELALRGLRAAAPHSSSRAIRQLVERELGAPIDRLFADWQDTPFASASIGQVHRARLFDGRSVAVKVQHPGIERAIDADLKNGAVLESLVGVLGPKALDSRRMYTEIAQRIREELDYRLEAERQSMFARIHAARAVC